MDISPFYMRKTPQNLRAISTPDQLAFDTSLSVYSELVRPGWTRFKGSPGRPDYRQISSPLNDIPEHRDVRAQPAEEIWPALAARPLMSKLKSVGPDGKVVDRKALMESPDERAIAFDAELQNYYDLMRPPSREDFHIDQYGLGYRYYDSTSPLFCVPDYRKERSDWRKRAWGALAVWSLKGKLMKVGFAREGDGRGSVVEVRPT